MSSEAEISVDRLSQAKSGQLIRFDQLPTHTTDMPLCSWPLTTIESRVKLHNIMSGMSFVLWDECQDKVFTFAATDIVVAFEEREDPEEPGTIVGKPTYYFIGPKGTYRTRSGLTHDSLTKLIAFEGPPPWNPPIIFSAYVGKTRSKNRCQCLTYVGRGDIEASTTA
jgi:hypothetical protein